MKTTHFSVRGFAMVLAFSILALVPVRSDAQSMSVSPDNLVLNAVGNFTNIQCQYSIYLPSGSFESYNIIMSMNGVIVAQAVSLVYCPIDNVLFVEFDRAALQSNPYVIALANTGPVTVVITGTFVKGGTQFDVDRTGYMTVMAPGKKGSN